MKKLIEVSILITLFALPTFGHASSFEEVVDQWLKTCKPKTELPPEVKYWTWENYNIDRNISRVEKPIAGLDEKKLSLFFMPAAGSPTCSQVHLIDIIKSVKANRDELRKRDILVGIVTKDTSDALISWAVSHGAEVIDGIEDILFIPDPMMRLIPYYATYQKNGALGFYADRTLVHFDKRIKVGSSHEDKFNNKLTEQTSFEAMMSFWNTYTPTSL